MRKTAILLTGLLLACGPVLAQQSSHFTISDHQFNAAGHPQDGVVLGSPSFRITMDSVGEMVAASLLSSPSFSLEGSFGACYPPPGEVGGLRFDNDVTLRWDHERSAGRYNLYRAQLVTLEDRTYGECEQFGLPGTLAVDGQLPGSGAGYFYLITAKNRLDEEGTKGLDDLGDERRNLDPCP